MIWEIEGELIRSARPCYDSKNISARNVKKWLDDSKKEHGIKSIICLLCNEHLSLYPMSLINFYKLHKFDVFHLKIADNNLPTISQLDKIYDAFESLPKPVLIHCSAGMARSHIVSCYIKYKRMNVKDDFENIMNDIIC